MGLKMSVTEKGVECFGLKDMVRPPPCPPVRSALPLAGCAVSACVPLPPSGFLLLACRWEEVQLIGCRRRPVALIPPDPHGGAERRGHSSQQWQLTLQRFLINQQQSTFQPVNSPSSQSPADLRHRVTCRPLRGLVTSRLLLLFSGDPLQETGRERREDRDRSWSCIPTVRGNRRESPASRCFQLLLRLITWLRVLICISLKLLNSTLQRLLSSVSEDLVLGAARSQTTCGVDSCL